MSNIVELKSGGKISPIVPTSIEEVFRLANAIHKSGLAPNGIKSPEQITIAIIHGMEIGLPPLQAVQKIAVVNGRPTIWGDAVPALLWAKGFKLREWMAGDGEIRCAFCEVTRPDGTKIERAFSISDAKTARLWGKQGPWQQFPERMMQMRARGYACRDGASDVLSGLYFAEEMHDTAPMRDITTRMEIEPPSPDLPQIAATATQVVDPLPDPDGYCEHIKDQLRDCPPDERDDVMSSNQDMIERLPAHLRKQVDDLKAELSA